MQWQGEWRAAQAESSRPDAVLSLEWALGGWDRTTNSDTLTLQKGRGCTGQGGTCSPLTIARTQSAANLGGCRGPYSQNRCRYSTKALLYKHD